MAKVGSIIAAFRRQIVRILRLQSFILRHLPESVLPGIGVQHAPASGESLFQFHLQAMRGGGRFMGFGADSSNVGNGGEVGTSEVGLRRITPARIHGVWSTEIRIRGLDRLVQVAQKRQLHTARAHVGYLQRRIFEQRALNVQVPFLDVGSSRVKGRGTRAALRVVDQGIGGRSKNSRREGCAGRFDREIDTLTREDSGGIEG